MNTFQQARKPGNDTLTSMVALFLATASLTATITLTYLAALFVHFVWSDALLANETAYLFNYVWKCTPYAYIQSIVNAENEVERSFQWSKNDDCTQSRDVHVTYAQKRRGQTVPPAPFLLFFRLQDVDLDVSLSLVFITKAQKTVRNKTLFLKLQNNLSCIVMHYFWI